MPTTDIQKLIDSAKTQRAKGQIKANDQRITAMGGKPKKGGPPILSRIFDVLSRGQYATAEASKRLVKGENIGDIAKGAVGGLAGKNKTSYSHVLEAAGVKNKWVKGIGGLAGDILLDPTTYIGGGLVKKISKEAAEKTGLEVAQKTVGTAERAQQAIAKAEAAKVARSTRGAQLVKDKAAKGGQRLQTAEEVARKADTTFGKVMKSEATDVQKEIGSRQQSIAKDLLEKNPGKVQLKFAGKKIAESEKLYKGVANVGDIFKATQAGEWLNKGFRTGATFAGKTNQMRRVAELTGIAQAEDHMRAMRAVFKDVSKDDKVLISHTLEKGNDVVAKMVEARPELAPLFQASQDAFRLMGEKEVQKGVFKSSDDLMDNYVYHHYEGGNSKAREAFKNNKRKAVGPEKPGYTEKRILGTLDEAKAAGLKPTEAIDDILARRMGKHYQATARADWVRAVEKEYGVTASKKAAKTMQEGGSTLRAANSRYLSGDKVFPEHVAKSIEAIEKMHSSDEFYNQFLRNFDKVQGYWKFGATTLNPGHHFRNMIGDAFNNFIDGVSNPYRYEQAAKLVLGKDDGFKIKTKFGDVNRARLEELIVNNGAKSGFVGAELLQGGSENLAKGVMGKANRLAGKREEYMRSAHFIDALVKESKTAKTLEEAAAKAGERVRKWNIDYGDITDFEKSVMKRAVPFYTWSRKNLPLQIEAMAMRPGRVATVPKGQAALQRILGTDEGGTNNFGDLDTVPKWLKEMAPIRLRGEGEGKNAIYWAPGLPLQDLAKYTEGGEQGIAQSLVSQLTPALRIPFEKATGKQAFSGANMPGNVEYAAQQNPLLRQIYNMTTGKQKLASTKTLNYLGGVGAYEVTPEQVQGELGRQQKTASATVRKLREKAQKK